MNLIINSTDFSNICTAIYYSSSKFLPSWLVSDVIPKDSDGNEYTCLNLDDSIDMINELPCPFDPENEIGTGEYYRIDEGRYYAFISPEIKTSDFQAELNRFVSDNPEQIRPKKVYYHGSKNRIIERDFAEYDFSWLVDKGKFNEKLKIQYLDDDGKDLIGKKVEELSKLEDILFPTSYQITQYDNTKTYNKNDIVSDGGKYYKSEVNDNTGNNINNEDYWKETELVKRNYYGTTQIGTNTIFVFPTESEITKIELYDDIIQESDLGFYTDYDYRVLTSENYVEYDPEGEYSIGDIVKFEDEGGKNITLFVSLENSNIGHDPQENYGPDDIIWWREIKKPCLSIYLGSNYCWDKTDSQKYLINPSIWADNFSNGSANNNFRITPTLDEYFKGLDELRSDKIVWMVLTDTDPGQALNINLSYNSWSSDKVNPERNKWKYSIRNDEFWSTKDNMSIVTDKSGIIVDGRSSTILATEKIDTHPILTKKLKQFNLLAYHKNQAYNRGDKVRHDGKLWECIQSYQVQEPEPEIDQHEPGEDTETWVEILDNYSPYCAYSCGEFVIFDNKIWESLDNNNLGNRPDYSKKWIFRYNVDDPSIIRNGRIDVERLENPSYLNTQISILINPTGAGRVSPAGQITLDTDSENSKIFMVFENMGYELKPADQCVTTELPNNEENNAYTDVQVEENNDNEATRINGVVIATGIGIRKVILRNISGNLSNLLSTRKLIFNFREINSGIKISGVYEDRNYTFNGQWNPVTNLNLPILTPEQIIIENNEYSQHIGEDIKITRPLDETYKVTKIISRYIDNSGNTITEELSEDLEVRGSDQVMCMTDRVNYREANYIYYFDKNTNKISCVVGLEKFEMTDNMVDIPYGENHIFKFYPRDLTRYSNIKVSFSDNINPDTDNHTYTWLASVNAPTSGEANIITESGTAPFYPTSKIIYRNGAIPYFEIQLNGITGYIEIGISYDN